MAWAATSFCCNLSAATFLLQPFCCNFLSAATCLQGGALDHAAASTLYLGGLFEALTGRLFPGAASSGPGGGLAAALTIYKHATAAVPLAARRGSGIHEALAVAFGGLVVSELEAAAGWSGGGGGGGGAGGATAVQPGRARTLLLQVGRRAALPVCAS